MSDRMHLEAGSSPYPDGSGYAVDVVVRQDEGELEPQLRIEFVYQIPISEWPALKSGSEFVVVKERKNFPATALSHHKTYEDARRAFNKSKGATAIYKIREWLNFYK